MIAPFSTPQGRRIPVRIQVFGLDDAGHPGHFVSLAENISGEKDATTQVQAIYDLGMVGVAISNDHGMVAVNDTLLAMIGHTRADFEAGSIDWPQRVLVSEFGRIDRDALDRAKPGATAATYEKALLHIDGRRIPIECNIATSGGPDNERIALITDISARKAAEAARDESEARLARMIGTGMVGFATGAEDGSLSSVNDAFLAMIGWSRDDFERERPGWRAITAPDTLAADEVAIAQALSRGYSDPYEKDYIHRDGRRVPIVVAVVADPADPDNRLNALVFDQSKLKDAESSRARSEARLQRISDAGILGIVVIGRDGRIREANDAWLHLVGTTREAFASGTYDFNAVQGRELGALIDKARVQVRRRGYSDLFEREIVQPDGTRRPVLVIGTAADPGNPDSDIIGLAIDNSARRAAEAARDKTDARLRRLFDSPLVGIAFNDPRQQATQFNRALLDMLGLTQEQALEVDFKSIEVQSSRDPKARRRTERQLRERGYTDPFEREFERPDGTRIALRLVAGKFDPDDPASEGFTVAVDNSESKAARQALEVRVRQQTMLTEFAERLLESNDPDRDVLPWLFEQLNQLCGAEFAFSCVPDGEALRLAFCGAADPEFRLHGERLELQESVAGHVAMTRTPMHLRAIQTSDDPLAAPARALGARACLCKPVIARGVLFGTLSIISTTQDEFDAACVETFRQAARLLALTRQRIDFETKLSTTEERLRLAIEAAGAVVWERDLSDDRLDITDACKEMVGLDAHSPDVITAEQARLTLHPDDLEHVTATVAQAIADKSSYDMIYRTATPGPARWIHTLGRATYDHAGMAKGLVGLNLDVTEQIRSRDREKLLMREVDHRAKNLLAIVQSVVQLTRAGTIGEFKSAVNGRIRSLGHVHGLLADSNWDGVDLAAIVADELAPYRSEGTIRIDGPPVWLDAAAAQAVALVIHELATNAAKYGALSAHDGRLEISWRLDDTGTVQLGWRESGGPAVNGPPKRSGFGSQLIFANVEHQLGGVLHQDWSREGLVAKPDFPADPLQAGLGRTDPDPIVRPSPNSRSAFGEVDRP